MKAVDITTQINEFLSPKTSHEAVILRGWKGDGYSHTHKDFPGHKITIGSKAVTHNDGKESHQLSHNEFPAYLQKLHTK
jgi:hypothetical protein